MGLGTLRRYQKNQEIKKQAPQDTPKKPKKVKEGAKRDGKSIK